MSTTITALDLVLDEINQLREAYGLGPALDHLPCGTRGNPAGCPVATALGGKAWVASGRFWIDHDDFDDGHVLPSALKEFVDDFDNDVYPELEAL